MKKIETIQFSQDEEQALATIANIDCTRVFENCFACPFAIKEMINDKTGTELFAGCLLIDIAHICDKYRISREEVERYGNH